MTWLVIFIIDIKVILNYTVTCLKVKNDYRARILLQLFTNKYSEYTIND